MMHGPIRKISKLLINKFQTHKNKLVYKERERYRNSTVSLAVTHRQGKKAAYLLCHRRKDIGGLTADDKTD